MKISTFCSGLNQMRIAMALTMTFLLSFTSKAYDPSYPYYPPDVEYGMYLRGEYNDWNADSDSKAYVWSQQTPEEFTENVYGFVVGNKNPIKKETSFKFGTYAWHKQIGTAKETHTYVYKNKINEVAVDWISDVEGSLWANEDLENVRIIAQAINKRLTILDLDATPTIYSLVDEKEMDLAYTVQGDNVIFYIPDNTPLPIAWCVKVGDFYIDMNTYVGNDFKVLGKWVDSVDGDGSNGFPSFVGTLTIDMSTLTLDFNGLFKVGDSWVKEIYTELLLRYILFGRYDDSRYGSVKLRSYDGYKTYTTETPVSFHKGDEFSIIDCEKISGGSANLLLSLPKESNKIGVERQVQLENYAHQYYPMQLETDVDNVYPVVSIPDYTFEFKTVNIYPEKLYIIGSYNEWGYKESVEMVREADKPIYHATTDKISGGGWKIYSGNWSDMDLVFGMSGSHFVTGETCYVAPGGDDFPELLPGTVEITLNLENYFEHDLKLGRIFCTGEVANGHYYFTRVCMSVSNGDYYGEVPAVDDVPYFKDIMLTRCQGGWEVIFQGNKGEQIEFNNYHNIYSCSLYGSVELQPGQQYTLVNTPHERGHFIVPETGRWRYFLDYDYKLTVDEPLLVSTTSNMMFLKGDVNSWDATGDYMTSGWSMPTHNRLCAVLDMVNSFKLTGDNTMPVNSEFAFSSMSWTNGIGAADDCNATVHKNKISRVKATDEPATVNHLVAGEDWKDVRIVAQSVFSRMTVLDLDEHPVIVAQATGGVIASDAQVDGNEVVYSVACTQPWCVRVGDFYIGHNTYVGTGHSVLGSWNATLAEAEPFPAFSGTIAIDMSNLAINLDGEFESGCSDMYSKLIFNHYVPDAENLGAFKVNEVELVTDDYKTYVAAEPISIKSGERFSIHDAEFNHWPDGYMHFGTSPLTALAAGKTYTIQNWNGTINIGEDAEEVYPRFNLSTHAFTFSSVAGLHDVTTTDEAECDATAVYYNLQGIEVKHPVAGQIYIVRRGTTVEKVLYRE